MRFFVIVLAIAACGGPQVPMHNGYKSPKAQPWLKAKDFKLTDNNGSQEAKAEGDLSYRAQKRAAWFNINLAKQSVVDIMVEDTPPGDAVNDNFDLGIELLDPGNRKVVRKDLEEGDETNADKKTIKKELEPGHYFLHLYLQSRMDTCDYSVHIKITPTAPALAKSDFPAQVLMLNPLAQIPINDDAPRNYKPPTPTVVVTHKPVVKGTPKPPPQPAVTTISARIIKTAVVGNGTQITVGRGTETGASNGMKGKINGINNASFQLDNCSSRSCTAVVQGVTPDQIGHAGGAVTLGL